MASRWWTRTMIGRTAVSDPLGEVEKPDAAFETNWRSLIRFRLLLIVGLLGAWAIGVQAQLIRLQVARHDTFAAKARVQQVNVLEPEARRGDIVDRHGQLLAYSVESADLMVRLGAIRDVDASIREICDLVADCTTRDVASLRKALSRQAKLGLVRPARQMGPVAVQRVSHFIGAAMADKVRVPYVLEPKSVRYYPKLDLAAHVIGFVDADGIGRGGIESRYQGIVAGEKGRILVQEDSFNRKVFEHVERAPAAGASLELTIDLKLQHIAERELKAGIARAGADGGTAIVMDPRTGEVLALASYPTFNPNLFDQAPDHFRKNRAVQDTYEPGSTFKIVTASAALNEGVLTPATLLDCNPGILRLPGRGKPITEDKGRNYGVLSFEDVMVRSSNVCSAKAGLQIGGDRLMEYVQRFGFGSKAGQDFPGESRGEVTRNRLGESSIASMSMGYEIGVTPLQMAAAASAIANGGLLLEPRVLRAIVRDGRREVVAPRVVRRVVTPETAATLAGIMESVVERGTGGEARLERYLVAGKTGTAKKVRPNGGYSDTDYNVSFIGFVPSRDPVYTILVVVDTPRLLPKYGGRVAAPVFRRIADAALQYAGVLPSVDPAPPIVVPARRGLLPAPPSRGSVIANVGDVDLMPDLRGMSLRDAMRLSAALQLRLVFEGDGLVVAQSPAPGAVIAPGDRGAVRLERNHDVRSSPSAGGRR